jgi:hypothetical protein
LASSESFSILEEDAGSCALFSLDQDRQKKMFTLTQAR